MLEIFQSRSNSYNAALQWAQNVETVQPLKHFWLLSNKVWAIIVDVCADVKLFLFVSNVSLRLILTSESLGNFELSRQTQSSPLSDTYRRMRALFCSPGLPLPRFHTRVICDVIQIITYFLVRSLYGTKGNHIWFLSETQEIIYDPCEKNRI